MKFKKIIKHLEEISQELHGRSTFWYVYDDIG